MESLPSSEIRFRRPNGEPLPEPIEWEPARVVVDGDIGELEHAILTCQGIPVPLNVQKIEGQLWLTAEWPRSGCGTYRLAFESPERSVARTVSIRPKKISEDAFLQLLEDLTFNLPASIAWSIQKAGGLAGVKLRAPRECSFQQEVFRLRRAVEGMPGRMGLVCLLERLAPAPHQVLMTQELAVPVDKARRPHPSRFPAMLEGQRRGAMGHAALVPDTRPQHQRDVLENRIVAAFSKQVVFRLRRLKALSFAGAGHLHAQLIETMSNRVRVARRRASFLDDVRPLVSGPGQPTMVLLRRAEYRSALQGLQDLNREPAIYLDDCALDAPLESLPVLYQYWGTLLVLDVVLDLAVEVGWRIKTYDLIRRGDHGLVMQVLKSGPLLTLSDGDGRVIRLKSEPSYGGSGKVRSISFPQIPDVVVELEVSGTVQRLVLFDPKYKLVEAPETNAKPKKEDIDKMHAYRDALRVGEDGLRVVQYAAIFYPGPTVEYEKGLAALRAVPGQDQDLRRYVRAALEGLFD